MKPKNDIFDSLAWTTFFPYALARLGGLSADALLTFRDADLIQAKQELKKKEIDYKSCKNALLSELENSLHHAPAGYLRTALYNARKRFFHGKNVLWERILPDLNADGAGWSTGLTAHIHDYEQAESMLRSHSKFFEKTYQKALQNNIEKLAEVCDTAFLCGLGSSSQSLTFNALSFFEKTEKSLDKKNRQTALGLWQAIARVAAKTSPKGTWGPVALLDFEHWPQDLPVYSVDKTKAAPNVAILDLLYNLLSDSSGFHLLHPVRLNPSLQKTEKKYLFLAYIQGEERLQTLDADDILDFIVRTTTEPILYKRIAKRISKKTGVLKLECMEFVQKLIGTGFLVWEKPELGLSPNWAQNLTEHLAFLPDNDAYLPTMNLLRWLHSSAKTLPHQSPLARLQTQKAGQQQLVDFTQHFDVQVDGFSPEGLWYEDSTTDVLPDFSKKEITEIANALRAEIQQLWRFPLQEKQALAFVFFKNTQAPQATPQLLDFIHDLMRAKDYAAANLSYNNKGISVSNVPIGALLQPFRKEDGQLCVILNGLHIGGGKLFNRFLHFTPENVSQTMHDWLRLETENCWAEMGWSSAFNANFRPILAACALDVPEGKTKSGNNIEHIALSDVHVRINEKYQDHLELFCKKTGLNIRFLDTTPEATEGLPTFMQWLHALGTPHISKRIFEKKQTQTSVQTTSGWQHSARQYLGGTQDIVLSRAAWQVPSDDLDLSSGSIFLLALSRIFEKNGLPKSVFFYKKGEKPQYLDLQNPLSVLFFEKCLRQTKGTLYFEECLPAPENSLFSTVKGKCVGELAVEFRV